MATTAQEIFEAAMGLMDELDDSGAADTSDTAEYKNRVLLILNTLAPELYPYSDTYEIDEAGERPVLRRIKKLSEAVDLDDYCCRTVLPYGLAAQLWLGEDNVGAQFCQQRYEELKDGLRRGLPVTSEDINDVYGSYGWYDQFGAWT